MNVALYYPWIYLPCGAERVILELTGRSRHDWTLYTHHFDASSTFPGFSDRRVVELPRVSVERSMTRAAQAAWRIARSRLPLAGHDAVVVVSEGLGDLMVFRNASRPIVCLCLTPLRAAFDPDYRARALEARGAGARRLLSAALGGFAAVDRQAWKRYSRIVCISDEVRRRAVAGGLASADRLEVAHVGLGFEPEAPSERFDRFFLLPGRMMWTKNIELGIAAFQRFLAAHPEHADFRLVIAGIVDQKSAPYFEALREQAGGDPRIEFRVRPSDAELADLYASCSAVLFTAFNEDWGIVPIEGMAFGKPVIAVNRGGPRESVVDQLHGFLEPPDPDRFAARMADLAGDPALTRRLGRAAFGRAQQFGWSSFAGRMDDIIESTRAAMHHRSGLASRPVAASHVD